MRTGTLVRSLLTVGVAAFSGLAWTNARLALEVQPESRLWVDGTSTVRSFTCKATSFESNIDAPPGAVDAILGGKKAVQAVTVVVPAAKLDCGNGTMNEHMRKAIKANDNPTIEFHLASYDVAKGETGVAGTLNGTLKLGGVERQIAIPATATARDGGALDVTGTYELKLSDYGLKAPSLMLGTMRVGDKVKVGFDLVLKN